MPAKTIYISDDDVPLFEKAELMGGGDSLSAVVVEAVRRFVQAKEAEQKGMKEIALTVGYWPAKGDPETRKVRFIGREIASHERMTGTTSSHDDRGIRYRVFQTAKGKYLLYVYNWTRWQGEGESAEYHVLDALDDLIKYADERNYEMHILPMSVAQALIAEGKSTIGEDPDIVLDI